MRSFPQSPTARSTRIGRTVRGIAPTPTVAQVVKIAGPLPCDDGRNIVRIDGTEPSLEVKDYAGTYTSDLYGDVRLTVENGRLVLTYAPDYVADLEHWHHDTFRANWRRAGFGRAFLTFGLDRRARAVRLELDGFGEFTRTDPRRSAQQ